MDLTRTLTPPSGVTGAVYDVQTGLFYIATNSGSVLRWSPETNSYSSAISVGTNLGGVDVSPDGAYLLVGERGGGSVVHKVDLATLTVSNFTFDSSALYAEDATVNVGILQDNVALATSTWTAGLSGYSDLFLFDGAEAPGPFTLVDGAPYHFSSLFHGVITTSADNRYALLFSADLSGYPETLVFDANTHSIISVRSFDTSRINWTSADINGARGLIFRNGYDPTVFDFNLNALVNLRDILPSSFTSGSYAYLPVKDAQFTKSGNYLLVWTAKDDLIHVYDTHNWSDVRTLSMPSGVFDPDLKLSDDGRLLYSINYSGGAIVDLASRMNLTLSGTAGNDALYGDVAADTLSGGAGADTLDGGEGIDSLTGGDGDDVYYVDDADDVIVELAAGGTDSVVSSLSWTLGDNLENVTLTGSTSINGTGNGLANVITGNAAANALDGGAGADTLIGAAGADTLIGGAGDDVYIADSFDFISEDFGEGVDEVRTAVNYTLNQNVEILTFTYAGTTGTYAGFGNNLGNRIAGGAASDQLSGEDGSDTIYGGGGNDLIIGGSSDSSTYATGFDLLYGDAGDDQIYDMSNIHLAGGGGYATIDGGSAFDNLTIDFRDRSAPVVFLLENPGSLTHFSVGGVTQTGSVTGIERLSGLFGGDGADTLAGGLYADLISGGVGADSISGSAGDDTLDGGAGADTLIGGAGNDFYYVDDSGDVVTENLNEGTDEVRTTIAAYTLGANLENLTFVGTGAFTGFGNQLTNTLIGGDGNDVLWAGGPTSDTVYGGLGNDTLFDAGGSPRLVGGAGDDDYRIFYGATIVENANEGEDRVEVFLNNFTLGANLEILVFSGSGNFSGTGNALDNQLIGGAGNDTLNGGSGADFMSGGTGNDVFIVDDAGDVASELASGGNDTIRTSLDVYFLGSLANIENLTFTGTGDFSGYGNVANNLITGGSGNDTLEGLGGADTLDGGASADTLIGGLGDDVYIVDAGDTIVEATGAGADTVRTSANVYTLTFSNVENVTFIGTGAFNGTGNAGANVLSGGSANDTLNGGAGNDTLDGGGGADTIIGGAGDDVYIADSSDVFEEAAGGGTDTVRTSLNTYVLSAANVENVTFTGAGAANLTGSGIANILTGGASGDTFRTAGGFDTLIGGLGDDLYIIAGSAALVTELSGEGADTVRTSLTTYTLDANVETLVLVTSALNGFGNAENNLITGNDNANVLKGFGGDDTLDGAGGADSVSYSGAGGAVTVNLGTVGAQAIGGGEGSDTLISIENVSGSNFDDSLTGNSAANVLNGGIGNDTLNGGAGADTLAGGAGDDVYIVDAQDLVIEAAGGGNDTIRTALNVFALNAANVENVTFTGAGAVEVTGSMGANVLTGGAANDTLRSAGGLDTLIGGLGDDLYIVAGVASVVTEHSGQGTDTVRTSLTTYTLDANVENLVLVTGAVTGTGNGENNEITGHAGANSLSGLGGDDTLRSGGGADTLIGGLGDDLYVIAGNAAVVTELSGEGTDTVRTSLTTYTLDANVENLVLVGSALNGFGNEENNLITGNDSANVLKGFFGDDTLDGGLGVDTVSYSAASNAVTVNLSTAGAQLISADQGSDTLISIENVTGSNLNDAITGNSVANVLNGGLGNDTLDGGLGADTLAGGAGDDVYIFDASDVILEADGGGNDTLRIAQNTFVLAVVNIENVAFTGGGNVNLTGSTGANVLTGGAGNDEFRTGGGLDTLIGGAGNDLYVIGQANIIITENAAEGTDTVRTSLADYTLGANVENLILVTTAQNGFGNAENNSITGNAADNLLKGFAGNDTLDGGGGNDTVSYSGASSGVTVNLNLTTAQVIGGGEGSDTLISIENLIGSDFGDELIGNSLANIIMSGSNDDRIYSLEGADTLNGGLGADTLTGGSGDDVFVFSNAIGPDSAGIGLANVETITDFTIGADQIHLDNAIFTTLGGLGVLGATEFLIGTAAVDGDDHIIYNSSTGALFYDDDGNGVTSAIQIATLTTSLALSNSDFMVI